jgi:hypothetical protein
MGPLPVKAAAVLGIGDFFGGEARPCGAAAVPSV